MVREVHAGESVRAEIFVAMRYRISDHVELWMRRIILHTCVILLLIPCRIAPSVLWLLLLLLLLSTEHVLEELELAQDAG